MPLVCHPLRLPHFSKLSLPCLLFARGKRAPALASPKMAISPNSVDDRDHDRTDNLSHFYDLSGADNSYSKISINAGSKIIKAFSAKSKNLGPKSIIEPLQTALLTL